MKYLSILVIPYAVWRIYVNYKSNIKSGPKISIFVGALLALIGNTFFKDSLYAIIGQLILISLITNHILRSTRKSN